MNQPPYAHSTADPDRSTWEPLAEHLREVGELAESKASPFGFGALARVAGRLHDIGKVSAEFQAYIGAGGDERVGGRGSVDHSTAGAREAVRLYPRVGKLLAYAIAGHHGGLPDADALSSRLDPDQRAIPDHAGWERHAGELPPERALMASTRSGAPPGFGLAFLTRMIFSCLVDADFLATETFYARARSEGAPDRGGGTPLPTLADRLREHLAGKRREDTELNRLRSEVLDHATSKAALEPGLFTLTVPTGGGKTLTSLSFALEHVRAHGLRRVVYVIPFTSIIEQTAQVFREALGSDADILEHHASFDWEAALPPRPTVAQADSGEGADGLSKLRRAAENWDAPVVVTTAVQFFESLFAARTSRCRKLHNLAGAVIVLDEAQTLPLHLLRSCLAALEELARNYGASVVLCTATQPALKKQDGFDRGLDIPAERELAPDPPALFRALKRVEVERRPGLTDDAEVAERFAQAPQMLCIVNNRAHARTLFEQVRAMDGAVHLTTLMCPAHRRSVLANLRERLKAGLPVRLVATSLIEAGVDIDFPEVWRALAGLDQVAQAAGRCNREGRPTLGRVVVFEPVDGKPPHALLIPQQSAEAVLRRHDDPLSEAAVHAYFRQLYWQRGENSFDAARLEGKPWPIMPAFSEGKSSLNYSFETIARVFRLIDEAMEPVVVPWDERARQVLGKIAASDRPARGDLRTLQQYVVPLPPKARADWLAQGVLAPVHASLGPALLRLNDLAHYDATTGIRLDDPTHRTAEENII